MPNRTPVGLSSRRWCNHRRVPEPQHIDPATSKDSAVGIRLAMRHYFSTNFLWTALHLSRFVGELEAAEGKRPRFDMAHRSYGLVRDRIGDFS